LKESAEIVASTPWINSTIIRLSDTVKKYFILTTVIAMNALMFGRLTGQTTPLVPDIFVIQGIRITNNRSVLTISNTTGTRFSVQRTITLPTNWVTIGRTQFANTFSSTLTAGSQAFWRLQQPARPPEAFPFVPGSWTLVVLPDTQFYSESYPELFKDQTRWIVANKDRYNIKYVLHLGDIVNVPTATSQWINSKAAMSILDGQVPYALTTGNHDHGTIDFASDRTTLVNNYFPVSNYVSWPTLVARWNPTELKTAFTCSVREEWTGWC
jgi:hypothetical protein